MNCATLAVRTEKVFSAVSHRLDNVMEVGGAFCADVAAAWIILAGLGNQTRSRLIDSTTLHGAVGRRRNILRYIQSFFL
jgi:hypothetical protein